MSIYNSKLYIEDLKATAKAIVGIESLKHKNILVTGATGTIGSFVVDVLATVNQESGAENRIYAAGRSIDRLMQRFGDLGDFQPEYVKYDVNEPLEFEFSVDYIIHVAGNAHPKAFTGDPVGTLAGSILGTMNLLEYGRKVGAKRLLYVSSGEVYGMGDINIEALKEDYSGPVDIMSSRFAYPESKRATENLCASYYSQYGLETVTVRPCHTYGPWITDSDNRANVQFMRNVLNGEDIVLKSAGAQVRSYAYVSDCVSGLLSVLLCGNPGEAYNLANKNAIISIAGLAGVIAENENRKVIFENPDETDKKNMSPIARQVLNAEKLEHLGWKGQFDVAEGIKHTLSILKELKK